MDEGKFLEFVEPLKAPQTSKRKKTAIIMERKLSDLIIGSEFVERLTKSSFEVKKLPCFGRTSFVSLFIYTRKSLFRPTKPNPLYIVARKHGQAIRSATLATTPRLWTVWPNAN